MLRDLQALAQFLIGVAAGLVAGYAIAQLLAPDEGNATRRRLLEDAAALRADPHRIVADTQARIDLALTEGKRAADEVRAELEAQALHRHPPAAPARTGSAPL
jgi:gas vesicle protein